MICFVFPHEYVGQAYTLDFFYKYAPQLLPYIKTTTYRELPTTGLMPRAWIFAGLDQADDVDRQVARKFEHLRPLNFCPLFRFELLTALHAAGINSYRVHASRRNYAGRFPVFARIRHLHDGPRTTLLTSQAELDAIDWQPGMMLAEYVDVVSPDGLYRKYSVQRVGDRFIPRHMLVGKQWIVKYSDRFLELPVEEEERFLAEPVRPEIIAAFKIAGAEYGRIDYSLSSDDKPQIWEINLNPELVLKPSRLHEQRRASQQRSADQIASAFAELAGVA